MAVLFLEGGGLCHVSEEDREAVEGLKWRTWALKPSGNPAAWVRLQRRQRRFDLFLHRLIAVRAQPEIARRRFIVLPRDGDYLNCQRENLSVQVQKKRAGRGRFAHFSPEGDLCATWAGFAQGRG